MKKWNEVLPTQNRITYGGAASYLHEYAVAFLFDLLTKHLNTVRKDVRVVMADGEVSGNLLEGVTYIDIPDGLTAVGGSYPDIVLKDAGQKPIRVVEVERTNSTPEGKRVDLEKRGVNVVRVRIHKPEDLKILCWQPLPKFAPDLEVDFSRHRIHPTRISSGKRFGRYDTLPLDLESQRKSDENLERWLDDVQNCNPTVRRRLLAVLSAAREPDSLYPIAESSPHRSSLEMEE